MKKILVLLSLLISSNIYADSFATKEEAKELVARVMKYAEKGEVHKGFELFKPYLIIPVAEYDVMVNNLKMQQPTIEQRFGKTVGVEFIKEDVVGDSLMRIIYLHKYEKHFMRWEFYFYKARDTWVLNTFNYDDKFLALFD